VTFETEIDVLVVGAGFAGCVAARELAEAGRKVHIIDKRAHIAGNAYDSVDGHGVMIHNYGPHIFHTNSERVFRWLSRFTDWRFYEHRVLAKVGEQMLPVPINRTTINSLYGLDLDEQGVTDFLESKRVPRDPIRTSEDVVLNSVGEDLCDKFFRGYTRKQWGLELNELSAGVAARIPTRTNNDDRYFTDTYQLMPLNGYTKMFGDMLDHPNITVQLEVDFNEIRSGINPAVTVYTGPIDEFYQLRFGKLPYRSLRFEHRIQAPDWTAHSRHLHCCRVSTERGRSLLSGPERRQRSLVQEISGLGRSRGQCVFHRPARAIPLLQHGPGRGGRTRHCREDQIRCR
jgi:UDP-galactopyranose mutase